MGRAELYGETCGDSKVCLMGLGLLRRASGRGRGHQPCACFYTTAALASQMQEGHQPAVGRLLLERLLARAEKPRCSVRCHTGPASPGLWACSPAAREAFRTSPHALPPHLWPAWAPAETRKARFPTCLPPPREERTNIVLPIQWLLQGFLTLLHEFLEKSLQLGVSLHLGYQESGLVEGTPPEPPSAVQAHMHAPSQRAGLG